MSEPEIRKRDTRSTLPACKCCLDPDIVTPGFMLVDPSCPVHGPLPDCNRLGTMFDYMAEDDK